MAYDAMTDFVKMTSEASLAKLMHEYHSPTKPKRQKFGRPDNRKGKQLPHVINNIARVRQFEGIFSINDIAEKLSIQRGQAVWLVKVMLKKNEMRRVRRLCGEGELKYKVDIKNAN